MEDIIIAKDINLENYLKEEDKLYSIEEAIRGNFKGIGYLTFKVKGNEGFIPHFHIEDGNKIDTCICIFVPMYFHHKSHVNTEFDGKTKKAINTFLKSAYNDKMTYWEFIRNTWINLYYISANETYRDALKNHFIKYGLYDPKSGLDFNPMLSIQPKYDSMYTTIHEK